MLENLHASFQHSHDVPVRKSSTLTQLLYLCPFPADPSATIGLDGPNDSTRSLQLHVCSRKGLPESSPICP